MDILDVLVGLLLLYIVISRAINNSLLIDELREIKGILYDIRNNQFEMMSDDPDEE